MARVLIRTQAWGSVTNAAGLALSNLSYVIKNIDGTAATHWSAETGGTSSTASLTTDADGGAVLSGADRWLEMGEYDVTVNGKTYRVTTGISTSVVSASSTPAIVTGVLPVFNVVDGKYGAKGDGATDNYAAFAAAIADASAAGGGIVYVPASPSMYRTSLPVQVPQGVLLKGAGPKASVIGAATTWAGGAGSAVVTNADHTGGQEWMWVEDLTVHATNHADYAILIDSIFINSSLRRVYAQFANSHSLVIQSTASSSGPLILDDVVAVHAGGDCVNITGAWRQLWIRNLDAEYPAAGNACVRIIATGGTGIGHYIGGLHMENFNNGVATGLVLDGVVNCEAHSIFVTGTNSGGKSFDDVVQIKNSAAQISLRKVTGAAAAATNIVNDTVNNIAIAAGASGTAASRVSSYETDPVQGPGATANTIPKASGNGLLGWTFDPASATLNAQTPNLGSIYLVAVPVPTPIKVTNVLTYVTTVGATLTANQCLVGLFSSSGTLIASGGDQSVAWTSTGLKTAALTGGPFTVGGPGQFVWAAVLVNGTTAPKFAGAGSSAAPDAFITNAGLSASTARSARNGTSLTALASITPSSNVAQPVMLWAGLS